MVMKVAWIGERAEEGVGERRSRLQAAAVLLSGGPGTRYDDIDDPTIAWTAD